MTWIVKLEVKDDDREWYVTQIRKDGNRCDVTTDKYHAKVYSKRRFFEGLKLEHQVIDVPECERHLYEHEKINYRDFR